MFVFIQLVNTIRLLVGHQFLRDSQIEAIFLYELVNKLGLIRVFDKTVYSDISMFILSKKKAKVNMPS